MFFKDYRQAADYILSKTSGKQPSVGIILGSGLGSLADIIENPVVIPYRDIPGFPVSTAVGHKGNLIFGQIAGHNVLAMQGRFHYYEGYPMESVTMPVRVMKLLGVETLLVSNAAGGVNFGFKVGDLMIIKDQINLLPNPLIGANLDEFGTRFPDMTRPFDPELIKRVKQIAEGSGSSVREGVYVGDTGPSYETPAEYNYYRLIGGDAVGMSTVPEVIVARHCSIRCFGMSVITNETHEEFDEEYTNDGDDVVEAANAAAAKMTQIFIELIKTL